MQDKHTTNVADKIVGLNLKTHKFFEELSAFVDSKLKKKKKSEAEKAEAKRVIVWVDKNFQSTVLKLGSKVQYLFSDPTIKLVTLSNICDVETYFKHLFLIKYKQRTEKYMRKYSIVM